MKIYKKYLLKNLFKYFVLILFISTTIIWITRIIKYIFFITEYGLDFKSFFKIIISVLPNLLLITFPLSAFISIIFFYNKLIKNNELIILQNSGLTKTHLLLPSLFLSIFICFMSFSITLYFLPKNNIEFENIKIYMKSSIANILLSNSNNFNNFKNITIYSKEINNNILKSVIIYITEEGDGKRVYNKAIYAKYGIIVGNYITLLNGNIQEFNIYDNKNLKLLFFNKYTIDISQYYNLNFEKRFDENLMFLDELLKIKNKNQKIISEIINRILNPLISIVLAIFSSILVLNLNFTRAENNKQLFIIYLLCIIDLSLFLYSFKILDKNINGIYITILSFIIPLFYSLKLLKK